MAVKNTPVNIKKGGKKLSFLFYTISIVLVISAIAFNIVYADMALFYRVLIVVAILIVAFISFLQSDFGKFTLELGEGTRSELRKVVWPTKNEAIQTSIMVFVFVVIVGLFLWLTDSIMLAFINFIII